MMSGVVKKSSKKKKVSQEELRRLAQQMKQRKQSSHAPPKNPYAASSSSLKRPAAFVRPASHLSKDVKRLKSSYDQEDLETKKRKLEELKRKAQQPKIQKQKTPAPQGILKNSAMSSLVSGYDDSSDESEEEEDEPPVKKAASSSSTHQTTDTSSSSNGGTSTNQVLPENFFDDPDLDAKMHGKETQAQIMDKQWELFQREVQHEEGQSEQIIEEDHVEENLSRQIMEINEQIQYYEQLIELRKRNDSMAQKPSHKMEVVDQEMEDDDSTDGSDDEEYTDDWRSKNPFS